MVLPSPVDRLAVALDALPDPVITLDPVRDAAGAVVDFVYVQANIAACTYNGLPRDELLGATMLGLFPGMVDVGLFKADVEVLETGRSLLMRDMVYGNEQRGGEDRRYDLHVIKAGDAIVITWRDVTERFLASRDLRRQAQTDALTGLVARAEGLAQLQQALGRDRRVPGTLAVAYVDVDGLKATNDRLGHSAGDELLFVTAVRIRSCVRGDDIVVRVGGDEILVVLHGVRSLDAAAALGEKMRAAVALPLKIEGQHVSASVSVGVTMARPDDDEDSVTARADAAMYDAKRAGGNRVTAV